MPDRKPMVPTSRGWAAAGLVIAILFVGIPSLVLAGTVDSGILEVCKAAAGPGVIGPFEFQIGARTVSVPVGACSSPMEVPAGVVSVTEVAQPGAIVTDVSTAPAARLISHSPGSRTATVAVAEGDISTQTVVTFTNAFETGELKVCKVAGPGVTSGTNVVFMVGARAVNVPAGPAPGGYCSMAGSFLAGTEVSVAENPVPGFAVSAIAVAPPDRASGADLADGQVNVTIGPGTTEVTFVNQEGVPVTTSTTSTTTPGGPTTSSTTPTTRPTSTSTTTPAVGPSTTSTTPARGQTTTTTTTPGGPTTSSTTPTTRPTSTSTTTPGVGPSTTSTTPPRGQTTTTTTPRLTTSTTAPCVEVSPTTLPAATSTSMLATTTTTTTTVPCAGASPAARAPGSNAPAFVPGRRLPRTGSEAMNWALWGLAVMLFGALAVRLGGSKATAPLPVPAMTQDMGRARHGDRPARRMPRLAVVPADDFDLVLADPPFLSPLPS